MERVPFSSQFSPSLLRQPHPSVLMTSIHALVSLQLSSRRFHCIPCNASSSVGPNHRTHHLVCPTQFFLLFRRALPPSHSLGSKSSSTLPSLPLTFNQSSGPSLHLAWTIIQGLSLMFYICQSLVRKTVCVLF